jgi:hypothetical protein
MTTQQIARKKAESLILKAANAACKELGFHISDRKNIQFALIDVFREKVRAEKAGLPTGPRRRAS